MVRSSYGGMFAGFVALLAAGAWSGRLEQAALWSLLAFMGGFAIGRIVSLAADGVPGMPVLALLALEIVYATAAGIVLWRQSGSRDKSLNPEGSQVP